MPLLPLANGPLSAVGQVDAVALDDMVLDDGTEGYIKIITL